MDFDFNKIKEMGLEYAEKGRHEDLLNNHGLYAHLWDIQTQIAGWKL